jgi:hypothetical protein
MLDVRAKMQIKIFDWGTLTGSLTHLEDGDIGLRYISLSNNYYNVIDKELFFISVIEHGIVFKELNLSM